MVSLGQCLEEGLVETIKTDNGTDLQQSTENNHIENLSIPHLCRLVHGIDAVDGYILPCRRIDYSEAIIDKYPTAFQLWLKLLERWLVEHNGDVVFAEDRRRYPLVADDDCDIGCPAALLRSVGWHPSHFLSLHET